VGDTAIADAIDRGGAALAAGDWEGARSAFSESLAVEETPEALDGLGRSLWWLGDLKRALDHRERAYRALRERGDDGSAALIALWLAREYREAVGNEPASNGWVARAEGLLRGSPPGVEHGWLRLTQGDRSLEPERIREHAEAAMEIGRSARDANLEASALALLGRARVLDGDLDGGMTVLDEAMTAATSGEVTDPLVFGDLCCIVTRACEEAGELERLMRWNDVILAYLDKHHHGPLIRFCGTCGAEAFLAKGDIRTAEACLVEAIQGLEATGHRSRCIQPNTKLAELRVVQGRIEEAERLLEGVGDLPEAVRPMVALHRMKGEYAVAAAILLRRLNVVGDTVVAVPLLSTLVEVQIAQGDLGAAAATAERLASIAEHSGHPKLIAARDLARGRIAHANGDLEDARARLEEALNGYTLVEMPLDAARTRVELARTLQAPAATVAAREARLALETFERLGAAREADEAAALVRELGGPKRTGPKDVGLLTAREAEILELLGDGLSNAEIAARLYISTKTAGNHVSNILAKLHLRSRQEAAAFAVRSAPGAGRDRR
jgi:DNA-binding NarL/FixJ family response regulator